MAKSLITATVILGTIAAMIAMSFIYTQNTANMMTKALSSAQENFRKSDKGGVDEVLQTWESRKTFLTYIINHRYIEDISESLLKIKQRAEIGNYTDALHEADLAIFYINGLPENEKVTVGNIF